MPTTRPTTPIADELTALRHRLLTEWSPEELSPAESPAIGRELNEWRRILARLHNVHNSPNHNLEGWGTGLEPPPAPPAPVTLPAPAKKGNSRAAVPPE